jgi:hypothetical protein
MALKSDNVEFVRYCGGHFENGDQSGINSGHHYLPTYQSHFQNGHHNTSQIQHCPISTPFHMWVDYDVPNRFLSINSGHHYLTTYKILMISDNVEYLRYCGGHFENGDR